MAATLKWLAMAFTTFVLSACGDDSDSNDAGLGGRCLSDQEICQFTRGVSTKEDVQRKLGNAQQYLGSQSAIYVCQQVTGQQIVHNDLVTFSYDSSGVLESVNVIRQGTGATPPPSCAE